MMMVDTRVRGHGSTGVNGYAIWFEFLFAIFLTIVWQTEQNSQTMKESRGKRNLS
jgi:hypothetical protein